MTHKEINQKIVNIWESAKNKGFNDFTVQNDESNVFLSPGIFPSSITPDKCKLLIIGLNPSYSLDGWKENLRERKKASNYESFSNELKSLIDNSINDKLKDSSLNEYFNFSKWSNHSDEILQLDQGSFKEHPYFKKMWELAKHIYGINEPLWYHHDLYFYRKTSQNDLKKLMKVYPFFFEEQVKLSKSVIEWLSPEIILVANAYSGEIFRNLFSISEKLNELTGTNEINFENGNSAHVLFSGMLSGQRALDLGTYARLKWHMKAVHDGKVMKK